MKFNKRTLHAVFQPRNVGASHFRQSCKQKKAKKRLTYEFLLIFPSESLFSFQKKENSPFFFLLIFCISKRIETSRDFQIFRIFLYKRTKMFYCIPTKKQILELISQALISIMECKLKLNNHKSIELHKRESNSRNFTIDIPHHPLIYQLWGSVKATLWCDCFWYRISKENFWLFKRDLICDTNSVHLNDCCGYWGKQRMQFMREVGGFCVGLTMIFIEKSDFGKIWE